MGIDTLLARLSGLKSTGTNRWIARCPAHEDRSPSLAVRVLDDGRILVHCFAGCEVHDVLANVGCNFGDLFPERLTPTALPRLRAPFNWYEAMQCVAGEAAIVAIAAADMADGKPVDADRVALAAGRIASALEVAHGD